MYEDDYQDSVTLDDLLDDARYAEAEAALAAFAAEYPDEAWAVSVRALCLAELGRHDEAIAAAKDGVQRDPQSAHAHWVAGVILCDRNRLAEATTYAHDAALLEPADPRVHALRAQIHAMRGQWTECRAAAERGLAFDPDDEACASLRALSLRPADSSEDWTAAVDDLLDRYPASAWARAGKGWGLLETGRAGEARETFEQALALDPTSQWAQHGLIESIKAGNPLYATLLRVFIWLDRLPPRTRWIYFLGGLFAVRVLRTATEANPALAPATYPLIALWILFIVASWTAVPLSNFILSRTSLGRRLVRGDDLVAGNAVAGLFGIALVSGVLGAVTGSERAFVAAFCAAFMLIPVSAIFRCALGWPRTVMLSYVGIILVAAVVAVAGSVEVRWGAVGVVVVMSILGSWIGVFLGSRVVVR
jgi:tetratricopeptide (TPR) repeat protein